MRISDWSSDVCSSDLHIGGTAQTEGIVIAVSPDDLVGQWFAGQEKHLVVPGEIGDRQPDVRQKGAGKQIHLVAHQKLLRGAYGVARIAVVVAARESGV